MLPKWSKMFGQAFKKVKKLVSGIIFQKACTALITLLLSFLIILDTSLPDANAFDYKIAAGILILLILLELILILFMRKFCKSVYNNIQKVVALSIIIIITLTAAKFISGYSILIIPIFLAPMLISILLDLGLAVISNIILTIAVSLITKGEFGFLVMSVISGTITSFVISKAKQRSKLSAAGLLTAGINAAVIMSIGVISRGDFQKIVSDSMVAALNGLISIILTIGILPFIETGFNIVTPLKLLELANPNHPLLKRLLVEAPGTYHHSLMVGNMAEVAAEAIGGNALLARVGAYYHDVGKIKRPNFFKENQLSDNPHDRMTPNLSTLVITSHTHDGAEIAREHKIPQDIIDIIKQHHGSTMVACFYHKAQKDGAGKKVRQEDFRYNGPRPTSREAAVVMLADSVEAAVRSMTDRTEGKIEGLIRKIIKDKLEDGQFDMCELTLKDLNDIANGFLRVFSGYFHGRLQYPDTKAHVNHTGLITTIEQVEAMSARGEKHE